MRSRTPISLFPFLSVLISTMGVLSFIAVTFLLFSSPAKVNLSEPEPVEVRWGSPCWHPMENPWRPLKEKRWKMKCG